LNDELGKEINYEISEIDKLLDEGKPLLDLLKLKEDSDFIEKIAGGSFLHSFYNGIEKSVILIYKKINEEIPNDFDWHKNLFEKTFNPTKNYPAIFSNEFKTQLRNYLKFRHFFRHTYGHKIDPKKLKPLIYEVGPLWEKIKNDLINFVKSIEKN
jgi:hypothetical protein